MHRKRYNTSKKHIRKNTIFYESGGLEQE